METAVKPSYWSRWRAYGGACFGHHVQGFAAGWLVTMNMNGAIACLVWAYLFTKYQELSFQRKQDWEGRGDTAGLDTMDFLVGFVLALTARTLLGYALRVLAATSQVALV